MDNELITMIMSDSSPSDISDAIKSMLFSKSSEKIEQIKPYVAASMFGSSPLETTEEE